MPTLDVHRSVFRIVVVNHTLLETVVTPLIKVRARVDRAAVV